ncbi:retinoic acid early transcript 1E [Microtus pennsylvanicus]|uniref:retinoic acid early transcript 1E n=1 Tax=Microtus pennsylvanicus TaxID=10058 RepID=UPI003F6D0459
MAKAAATRRNLSLVLCLFLLLSCLGSSLWANTHSLRCDVIVKVRTTAGQPWCEGQCSLDGVPFLKYNNSKFTPLGNRGNAVNGTQVWTDMTQRLDYLGQELRKILANSIQEMTKTSGQPTLQATMLSQYEHRQSVGASWRFNISGKYSFLFNTMNMNWTLIDPEAGGIMNQWKDDTQFIKDLRTISTADCRHWLKELLKHPKEKPRSTSRVQDITQLPSAINTTQLQHEKGFIDITSVIAIILPLVVGIFVKKC